MTLNSLKELSVARLCWERRCFLEERGKNRIVVSGIILGKSAACFEIMLRIVLHQSYWENTSLGFQDRLIHIGGVDPTAVVKPFFLEQDRQGRLPRLNIRMPDPNIGIGSQ